MDPLKEEVDDIEDAEVEIEIDEDEVVTETAEENPNVADQLSKQTGTEGTQTLEERYKNLQDSDPELAEYHGRNVKKRIDKLTYGKREAERQMDEAVTYAQGVLQKNNELETKLTKQDGAFIGEHKTRLASELESANQLYHDAYNSNDPEAMSKATQRIARVSTALANAENTETRFVRRQEENKDIPAPTYNPPAPQRGKPAVDSKTEEWAERNTWFGEDEEVTKGAMQIHKQLLSEGMVASSTGYFNKVDERLRLNFPDKEYWGKEVNVDPTPSQNNIVNPVNTNSVPRKARGKTVRLTASQRSIAKKLGISDQAYAKSMQALERER